MSWFAWILLLVLLLGLAVWTFVRAPGREQDPGLREQREEPRR